MTFIYYRTVSRQKKQLLNLPVLTTSLQCSKSGILVFGNISRCKKYCLGFVDKFAQFCIIQNIPLFQKMYLAFARSKFAFSIWSNNKKMKLWG